MATANKNRNREKDFILLQIWKIGKEIFGKKCKVIVMFIIIAIRVLAEVLDGQFPACFIGGTALIILLTKGNQAKTS